ncbi:MAG: CpsD/CapB family tyrosine-protein kinase [bacterium]|nr:CpsD/CapB family tyrosine-protein kinase [bacterium]
MKLLTLNLIEQQDLKFNEAINVLRSSVEFAEKEIKVLTFAGCTEPEGSWRIAINLANSFSKLDKKTLFLDANLRDQELSKFYQKDCGLADYLQHKARLEEIIYETNNEKLDIILPGTLPDNPSELLGGEQFKYLLGILRERYEYIIVNTPLVQELVDGIIVGRLSDSVIPVINQDKSKYKQAEEMKLRLQRSGCHILGCVFNQLASSKRSGLRLL